MTVGALVYPLPPSDITTLEIVPAAETTAVAAAATLSALLNITISFWKSVLTKFSFLGLKNGLKLLTYTIVDPIPTDFIRFVVGNILPSYSSRLLLTILPSINRSSVCFVHLTGLFSLVSSKTPLPLYAFVSTELDDVISTTLLSFSCNQSF